MRRTNLMLFVTAMGVSAVASLLAWGQYQKLQTRMNVPTKTVTVYVVKNNTLPRQLVASSDVMQKRIAANAAEPGAITNLSQIVGHYTASTWYKGQEVISPMVLPSNTTSAFPLKIPDGYRAFSINNDAVTGVDHLITPGDHVDVVTALPSKNNAKVVQTILQNVLVLYVDRKPTQGKSNVSTVNAQNSNQTAGSADTITLALTPLQIEKIEYAEVMGQVRLDLRNPTEMTNPTLPSVSKSSAG